MDADLAASDGVQIFLGLLELFSASRRPTPQGAPVAGQSRDVDQPEPVDYARHARGGRHRHFSDAHR